MFEPASGNKCWSDSSAKA